MSKTLGSVLSLDLAHTWGFIECSGRGILYLVSCRKARGYLTKEDEDALKQGVPRRLKQGIRNASLAAVRQIIRISSSR